MMKGSVGQFKTPFTISKLQIPFVSYINIDDRRITRLQSCERVDLVKRNGKIFRLFRLCLHFTLSSAVHHQVVVTGMLVAHRKYTTPLKQFCLIISLSWSINSGCTFR